MIVYELEHDDGAAMTHIKNGSTYMYIRHKIYTIFSDIDMKLEIIFNVSMFVLK